jgi:hypothetical protein
MKKDVDLIAEAYQRILNEKVHCEAAEKGCECSKCEECEKNQTVDEAKNSKPDYLDIDKDGDKKESMKKAVGDKKKKSFHKESSEMAQAYETILEYKLINKKFARRYNKLTSAMLKSQPGSEEYGKIKSEREDLVSILKDHGMSPKDLEEYLVKKERENPLPEAPEQNNSENQYNDNSYTDTADIPDNTIEVDFQKNMANPQAEVAAMPPDQPAQVAVNQ